MASPGTIIIRGLQMIGERPVGGTLNAAEQSTYLEVLNAMLESWSLDSLMCYQELRENFALTSGQRNYTIGVGGNFNTTRPTKLVSAFVRDSSNYDYPLELITDSAWNSITSKTVSGTYPSYLMYDQAFVSGLGTINLYPAPSAGLTLYISSLRQFAAFATIGETVSLPPGYQRALESNFAIEAAAGYTPISKELAQIATESKAAIKAMNAPTYYLKTGLSGRKNSILFG